MEVVNEAGHTKGELLQQVRQSGVTEVQFDRWRRAQLLPSPISRLSLGRGKGSVSTYPPGTAEQLGRLCELHFGLSNTKKERRLLFLAWTLWWEGYDIPALRVREFLTKHVVNGIDSASKAVRALSPEQRQLTVQELATKPLGRQPGPLGKARGHLRSNMPDFLNLILELLTGNASGDDAESLRLMEKANGMERGRTDTWLGQPLIADEQDHIPATIFAALLPMLDGSLAEHIERLSEAQLREARQTARQLWDYVSVLARFGRDARGKGGFGLGDFLHQPSDPREQALWFLVVGLLNEAVSANSEVSEIVKTFFTTLKPLATGYPQIEAVREVEPFRDLLSSESIEQATADPLKARELKRDLRRLTLYEPEATEKVRQAIDAVQKRQEKSEP